MFSRTSITPSTGSFSDKMERLERELAAADAVVIGAGAGLSASAGLTYDGERFERYFSDFEETCGFHDMYTGGFYPFKTREEYWAYWSRFILINRYMDAPRPVYADLLRLVQNKDYFVLTTNVDHSFQKAGFAKSRLFYTQGDYGLWQCSIPCHSKTYDNEEAVRQMVKEQKDRRVPTALLPRCPVCGAPMAMNLRSDMSFVEDEGWHAAADRYAAFIRRHRTERLLFLELGVGGNTPSIIKYPFWRMTAQWPQAFYVCINRGEAFCPREIAGRALCIDRDIGEVLTHLGAAKP